MTVVFLGDYIDRGPASKDCIDAILEFEGNVSAQVICLRGNHEDWLLRTLHDHSRHSWLLGMDAFTTIRSYSADAEQTLRDAVSGAKLQLYLGTCDLPYAAFFDRMPREHIEFFDGLHLAHRTEDCLCTHGGVDVRVARLEDQPNEALIWGAQGFPDGYSGAELVVYGHRNNAVLDTTGWPSPAVTGNTIGIDTIAHGVLTAIKLPGRQVFQSARYEIG